MSSENNGSLQILLFIYSHLSNQCEVWSKKILPFTFIDFLDFFQPLLLVYCSYVVVSKFADR